jgi:catechol 2,3-dioxygenase-like lactoylglutathione lyase family enzyme
MHNMRYSHTNIVARDVERLADFYVQVFGCIPLSSVERMSGKLLARGVGLQHIDLRAMWLRLPGHGENGPILEIFEYTRSHESPVPRPNQHGYTHISFEVPDIVATAKAVITFGGSRLGEIVDLSEEPGVGDVTFVYLRDPEGNIIELEHAPVNG